MYNEFHNCAVLYLCGHIMVVTNRWYSLASKVIDKLSIFPIWTAVEKMCHMFQHFFCTFRRVNSVKFIVGTKAEHYNTEKYIISIKKCLIWEIATQKFKCPPFLKDVTNMYNYCVPTFLYHRKKSMTEIFRCLTNMSHSGSVVEWHCCLMKCVPSYPTTGPIIRSQEIST